MPKKRFNELPKIKDPQDPKYEIHVIQVSGYRNGNAIVEAVWTLEELKEWIKKKENAEN